MRLHVKNFALIDEADVEFGPGLNILTGETGAGKSILIDAVTAALGQKMNASVIRKGADHAYIELVFSVEGGEKLRALRELEVEPEADGLVIVTRKLSPRKSYSRINDETVTLSKLKKLTSLLIDIHGQHEHQSLLSSQKHLEILDEYGKQKIVPAKKKVSSLYREYTALKREYEAFSLDENERLRRMDLIRYEISEIEGAAIKEGEEETLADRYRVCASASKIASALGEVKKEIGYESTAAAGEAVGRAVRGISEVSGLDKGLKEIADQLGDLEAVLNDCNRAISDYLDRMSVDEGELAEIRQRLDLIRNIQAKYGKDWGQIQGYLKERKEELEKLEHYEQERIALEGRLTDTEAELRAASEKLSVLRKKASSGLCGRISESLAELNFSNTELKMEFTPLGGFTANGMDEVQFLISTNIGEEPKPLGMVASGGELSRIMLAVKTVLADDDAIPTLIFDEIDTGISGRTAQMVSEKLAYIGRSHQVLCITHLPQIASMADSHYLIEKTVEGGKTKTRLSLLGAEECVDELARLLGGARITQAVRENASEMKRLAQERKNMKKKP